MSFWRKLPKPFFVLAPMAEVTDVVFRQFVLAYSRPDVLYTEFVACRGLLNAEGRKNLMCDLYYTLTHRPIVAQIFGGDPKDFYASARLICELGFDGVDINMGCPDKKVEKQGAGAALIKDPKRAQDIILATKEGAGGIPVAVKTRIGYNKIETESWIGALCEVKPEVITVHGRTRKEMSLVPARWDEIARAVEIIAGHDIVAVGNGDVTSREEGERKAEESGADGVMIGRGVFGNPWVFSQNAPRRCAKEKVQALLRLAYMFETFWRGDYGTKNFNILKKHVKAYVNGFDGAKELRELLMGTQNAREMEEVVSQVFGGVRGEEIGTKEKDMEINLPPSFFGW